MCSCTVKKYLYLQFQVKVFLDKYKYKYFLVESTESTSILYLRPSSVVDA